MSDVTHSQIGSVHEAAEASGQKVKVSNASSGVQESSQEGPSHGQTIAMANDENVSGDVQSCVECEDQHAELVCLSCEERFCRPCWGSLHR